MLQSNDAYRQALPDALCVLFGEDRVVVCEDCQSDRRRRIVAVAVRGMGDATRRLLALAQDGKWGRHLTAHSPLGLGLGWVSARVTPDRAARAEGTESDHCRSRNLEVPEPRIQPEALVA